MLRVQWLEGICASRSSLKLNVMLHMRWLKSRIRALKNIGVQQLDALGTRRVRGEPSLAWAFAYYEEYDCTDGWCAGVEQGLYGLDCTTDGMFRCTRAWPRRSGSWRQLSRQRVVRSQQRSGIEDLGDFLHEYQGGHFDLAR